MPYPESPKRRELRAALRAVTNHVASLDSHEFDSSQGKAHHIKILPMDLDERSNALPTFFKQCPASFLLDPNDDYDRDRSGFFDFDSLPAIHRKPIDCGRNMEEYFSHYVYACALPRRDRALDGLWSPVSLGDAPFVALDRYTFSEYITAKAYQVKNGPYPHAKAMIYNNLNGVDGRVLRGEVMIALRMIIAQMRRARFLDHMIAPILLFSFMGPQHARLVEAYFDGTSLVMRPTRLFDLRKKDEATLKQFGQWFFGEPTGDTKKLP
ncbi:hypothetical protein HFD88_010500 [Aspergillus terreus]|nr:hypothetical protein HFD88_010500 [Aspergillus terreus]